MTFNDDSITNNFKLQPETLLFNVSLKWGYNWQSFTQSDNAGGLLNYPNSWSTKFPYVACSDYIPIQPYDVIATRTSVAKGDTGSSVRFKNYHAHFYTENDASTYVGTVEISGDAIKRWSINRLARSNNIRTKLANGGYVRFTVETNWNPNDYGDTNYASFYRSSDELTGWSFPYDGWLQIYSGERYCLEIENENTNGMYDLPMQWFVIKSVEEESDGISSAKTVTAYSYEYTLSNRNISLSESAMPLYIPPQISSLVNGNGWVIDKEYGTIGLTYATQKLGAGLLNRVLELFPAWSIGHISSKLMTRYRSFDAVDNADIYKFLMGDVESAYQCYFVFDNNNIQFYQGIDYSEDFSVMPRLLINANRSWVDQCLYYYRYDNAQSYTNNITIRNATSYFKAQELIGNFMLSHSSWKDYSFAAQLGWVAVWRFARRFNIDKSLAEENFTLKSRHFITRYLEKLMRSDVVPFGFANFIYMTVRRIYLTFIGH